MDIGEAVSELRNGYAVTRAGWNGKGMYLILVQKGWQGLASMLPINFVTSPFVAMKTADDKIVPWLCSQTDLLATDWEVVDGQG